MQLQVTAADQRQQALAAIRRTGHPELNFIALALQGRKVNFGKVLKMIDEMVVTLKAEQQDDDDKKEYCEMHLIQLTTKRKVWSAPCPTLTKPFPKTKKQLQ